LRDDHVQNWDTYGHVLLVTDADDNEIGSERILYRLPTRFPEIGPIRINTSQVWAYVQMAEENWYPGVPAMTVRADLASGSTSLNFEVELRNEDSRPGNETIVMPIERRHCELFRSSSREEVQIRIGRQLQVGRCERDTSRVDRSNRTLTEFTWNRFRDLCEDNFPPSMPTPPPDTDEGLARWRVECICMSQFATVRVDIDTCVTLPEDGPTELGHAAQCRLTASIVANAVGTPVRCDINPFGRRELIERTGCFRSIGHNRIICIGNACN
jgi:hypothetical protein